MIKVDKTRKVTEEEYGYYWTWSGISILNVYLKGEHSQFYESSVYLRLQETPPEKPRVLADGWYIMMHKFSGQKVLLEKRGDVIYDLDKFTRGGIHLFDVVSGPVDFGKEVKNG